MIVKIDEKTRLGDHMEEERSRTKERLEISLAWLCELDILKQRQESLVLGALALGDTVPGCPAWGDVGPARSSREHEQLTLRRQLNRLQGAPSLLMLALQQQLSELRLDTGVTCEQNTEDELDSPSASSSGFYDQSECLSPPLRTCSTPNLSVSCHRPRSVDAYMLDWEGHMELTIHATLPRSFSAPYPPLENIAEGIEEEEEEDDESTQWVTDHLVEVESMADENDSLTPELSLNTDDEGKTDDGPTEEDIQQAMRVEAYILNLLQRRHLTTTPELDSDVTQWHTYPPSYPDLQHDQPEWPKWGVFSEDENQDEGQDGYYTTLPDAQAGPTSLDSDELESSLETDQYGAADVSSSNDEIDSPQHKPGYYKHRPVMSDTVKPHVHTCCNQTCSAPESREQLLPSQDWALLRSGARRDSQERWTSGSKRHINTTIRPQSEDSSPSQGWAAHAENKYYTVGKDTARHPGDKFYTSDQRLWCSSVDLSQEENEDVQEIRHGYLPNHTCVQFVKKHQRVGKGLARAAEPTDGSDSSLSGTFSPVTSSLSSDSDESGGLVWPQQLPPRLSPSSSSSSQNPSSSVVKIKASHALKKKIMRFRSGSLKLMTTV
ncbi:putative dapper-like protein 3-like [Triplophysa rosa]|uniref:Dapper-like protein 3-like n=1 Tax=Triplophysa rosa TaxID=992332 RepID=A0A9W7TUL7_TRIRA|nr:putative dapper-like protein 3-like [Triplophysa rosa]